jgi:type IV secretion system protein VirD4
MTGKTTVVTEKTSLSGSRSGHLKRASVSINETARPLLTPDECMRLPGLIKRDGKAKKPGDMLIFVRPVSDLRATNPVLPGPVFALESKSRRPPHRFLAASKTSPKLPCRWTTQAATAMRYRDSS